MIRTPLELLTDNMRQEFPTFSVAMKRDSRLMKIISVVLTVVTLGSMRTFMTDFITTIGNTVYVPDDWYQGDDVPRMIVLRHERVHMRQKKQYGMVLFSLMYLLFPLPGGLAYFRTKFEREAYAETIRATVELFSDGKYMVRATSYRAFMLSQFDGPAYFWMWPFHASNGRWYDSVIATLPLIVESVA